MQIFTYKYGISTHQTSLISLLSLCSVDIAFFSDLNYFLHVICCFIFPFLHLSSSVIFALLFYLFVIFHSCLHLVCSLFLSLHFLIFYAGLLNFSPFISFLCLFDNKPLFFLNHCTTFSFCLFFSLFPVPFYSPTWFIFYFQFLLFHCKADDIGKFCVDDVIFMAVFDFVRGIHFNFAGGIHFKLILD